MKKFKAITSDNKIIEVKEILFLGDGSYLVNKEFPIEEGKLITDEWISVEDRLPEVQLPVLVCVGGEVSLAWLMDETYGNGTYWEDAYTDHLQGITHWQPLPSLPQNK